MSTCTVLHTADRAHHATICLPGHHGRAAGTIATGWRAFWSPGVVKEGSNIREAMVVQLNHRDFEMLLIPYLVTALDCNKVSFERSIEQQE